MKIKTLNIPADTDICQLFEHYCDRPFAMLLDSGNSHHPLGRFDFFVADPLLTLQTRGGNTTITSATTQVCRTDDPMALLQQQMDKHFPVCPDTPQLKSLPFCGGAVGLWGYDLGRRFEYLPRQGLDDYQCPDMAVGLYSWAVIKDHHKNQFILVSYGSYPCPDPAELEQLVSHRAKQNQPFSLTSEWHSNMSETQYQQKFSQVKQYLAAGDCYQVNLAQRFSANYSGDEWQAYVLLREANSAPFSAFLRLPEQAVLSISPERFLAVDQQQVQTCPIKGTRPRHADARADQQAIDELQHASKDQAENLMIVDLLRNDLSKHCLPGSVTVPALFEVQSFAAVHHLVSTVEGRLGPDQSPLQLLRDAFPGGSITGAPKIRAMQIIDELEPHRRSVYCGSIGYISTHGKMDTNITIRTLLCEQQRIYCWAGGGLVIDSDGAAEYQETLDKVAKILPLLTNRFAANEQS